MYRSVFDVTTIKKHAVLYILDNLNNMKKYTGEVCDYAYHKSVMPSNHWFVRDNRGWDARLKCAKNPGELFKQNYSIWFEEDTEENHKKAIDIFIENKERLIDEAKNKIIRYRKEIKQLKRCEKEK